VNDVRFSPTGRRLASVGSENFAGGKARLVIWDVSNRVPIRRVKLAKDMPSSTTFVGDDSRVLAACYGDSLWAWSGGKKAVRLGGGYGWFFSADSGRSASITVEDLWAIQIWDTSAVFQ